MKSLVIYFSLTGNTKFIAEKIAQAIDADILQLEVKEELKSKGFMKFLWGGKQVFMKNQPKLLPFSKNPEDYDIIFLGTPVWAWSFAPALRSFLANFKLKNKKIALFCCHGGGKGQVFQKLQERLPDNEIIGNVDFYEPLKKGTEDKGKLAFEWAKKLLSMS